jgi:dolichol-phosphate mannosyltransferase
MLASRVVGTADATAPEQAGQAASAHAPSTRTDPILKGRGTLIVMPTYNERENLRPLLSELRTRYPEISILVVDDGSPDGTGALADQLATDDPRVHVMHRAGKQGLGSAYIAGFRWALARDFERVIEMDADFSHRPEDLLVLLRAGVDHDLVIGSRNIPGGAVVGWSRVRQFVSRGGSLYARVILGLPMHDCTSGFKCFSRTALESLDLERIRSNGYAFQVEVNHACSRAGLRLTEVPIIFPERVRGKSKMSVDIVLEAMVVVLKLRTGICPVAVLSAQEPSRVSTTG